MGFRISVCIPVVIVWTFLSSFSPNEVWFDDVDPEDLEEISGKRIKTCNGDPSDVLVTGNLEGFVTKAS